MEDKTTAAVFVRAGVVVVGIASVVYAISQLDSVFGFLGSALQHVSDGLPLTLGSVVLLIGAIAAPLVLLLLGVVLIRWADAVSQRFVGASVMPAEVVLYRVALAVLGLYFATRGSRDGLVLLSNLVADLGDRLPDELAWNPHSYWPFVASSAAYFGFGLYFFLGAPGLLGWHLKRCQRLAE